MISCILLSAGFSSRFGSPKALAKINNELVIEHLQKELILSKIDEIIIVLGAYSYEIEPYILKHEKVGFVYNKDYNFGQTSSFKKGLHSISEKSKGFLLFPVDYPFVKHKTINDLIDKFQGRNCKIAIPMYENKKGHPPIFDVSLKKDFLTLDNSTGLNTVAHKYKNQTSLFNSNDEGVILTFNTKEEFAQLRKRTVI